jgi:hypothetical protein
MIRLLYSILVLLLVLSSVNIAPAHAAGVVGNGTPASCTRNAIAAALVGGGNVTFNCGANPVTISIGQTLEFSGSNATIDGGGLVTLQGVAGVRIIRHFTWGVGNPSTLTLRNLTLTGASISGVNEAANGAAVISQNQSANFPQDIPTLNVENVTFTNNTSTLTGLSGSPLAWDFGGGAIYSIAGIVNISNSRFVNNRSNGGTGGAVHMLLASINIRDSHFEGNVATILNAGNTSSGYAGALYVDGADFRGGGGVTILNSTFINNRAANQGGAMYFNLYPSRRDFLTIDGSRFVGNIASGGGMGLGGAISGGAEPDSGGNTIPVTITNSLFADNQVSWESGLGGAGGGVAFAQPATIIIANTTFTNNRANGVCLTCSYANGGGIYITNNPVPAQITNVTIANNYAGWVGGGLSIFGQGAVLRNTIFFNNRADNGGNTWQIHQHCNEQYTNGGNNIQFPDRNPNPAFYNEVVCAAGITIADPLLATSLSTGGTLIPRAGSPAIDAGSNSVCAASPISNRDQRGGTRPQDGDGNGSVVCDIGAHEVDAVATTATINGTLTLQGRTPSSGTVQVRVTIGGNSTDYNVTVTNGAFSLSGLPTGSATIRVKHAQSLAVVQAATLNAGANSLNFGTLRTGDANNDNAVTLTDFSILASSFNRTSGQAGYDARADFNGDSAVALTDFSLLASNFNQVGQ